MVLFWHMKVWYHVRHHDQVSDYSFWFLEAPAMFWFYTK